MEHISFNYSYENEYDDNNESASVHKNLNGEALLLNQILAAFKDFLDRAGYVGIQAIVADCGDVEHSSLDA